MEVIVQWFADNLGGVISPEAVVFIVSLFPILECRGGLLVASLLNVDLWTAIPICIVGNFLPIPFILLFIKKIFAFLKRFDLTRPLVEALERRGMNKTEALANGEFRGLLLFADGDGFQKGDRRDLPRDPAGDFDHVHRVLRTAGDDHPLKKPFPAGKRSSAQEQKRV